MSQAFVQGCIVTGLAVLTTACSLRLPAPELWPRPGIARGGRGGTLTSQRESRVYCIGYDLRVHNRALADALRSLDDPPARAAALKQAMDQAIAHAREQHADRVLVRDGLTVITAIDVARERACDGECHHAS